MWELGALREWWDRLCELGPSFGYFVNAAKTWLVTKDHLFQYSISSFSGSGIRVTSNGRPYLGAAIGSESYIQSFVADKVKGWSEEITVLARFAESQPHAAYCAFTHGLSSHWMFVSRTVPFDSVIFQPLEDVIRQLFVPTLSGCPPPCDNLRQLFALPAHWGGLGIFNPTITSNNELAASRHIAEPLCLCIHDHSKSFIEAISFQQSRKSSVCKAKLDTYSKTSSELCQQLEPTLQRVGTHTTACSGASICEGGFELAYNSSLE